MENIMPGDIGINCELICSESAGNELRDAGNDGLTTAKINSFKQAETGNAQSDGSGETAAPKLPIATIEAPTADGSGENVAPAVVPEPPSVPAGNDAAAPDVIPKSVPATPPVTPISSANQSPPAGVPLPTNPTVSTPSILPVPTTESTFKAPESADAAAEAAPTVPIANPSVQDSAKPEVSIASETVTNTQDLLITNAAVSADASADAAAPAVVNVIAPVTESSPASAATTQTEAPKDDGWKQRESDLLSAIADLEKVKKEASSETLQLQLKVKDEEIDLLKARVKTLETELAAALTRPGSKNHEIVENIKQQHEELLSKARGMIFDKTKMVKNQELQIAALTSQVASLKDVNTITKDMLEIRNSEVKHLEERLETMESRFKAEKERHMLVLKKAETGSTINNDLKKEYETQLTLFKELRERYEQRVQALIAENKKLAESVAVPAEAAAATSAQP